MKKLTTIICGLAILAGGFIFNNNYSEPATGTVYILQDLENPVFPPAGWSLTNSSGYNWVWTVICSGYGSGTASAKADFFDWSSGNFDMITRTFPATTAGDSLSFDHAYCTFTSENDQLSIYTSDNGGSTWNLLITLNGGVGGPLVTAPPRQSCFVPTASQWATKRYALPTGTNKIKFTGVTAYGNNLYLDNMRIGAAFTNDVGVNAIKEPKWAILAGSVTPKATVRNYGATTQSFQVSMTINPGAYSNTQSVSNLAAGQSQLVTFAPTTLANNTAFTLKAYTTLGADQNILNDTLYSPVITTPAPRNVLLEYCTGTWCQWCPCGDSIAHALSVYYPDAIILSYHGPANSASDPYSFFNGNSILSLLGLNAYPSGNVDRRGHIEWGSFMSDAENRYMQSPAATVNIAVTSQTYNTSTRELAVTLNATALTTLTGQYKVNYVITENGLVYNQIGNGHCPGSPTWVHNWVVRNMVNGATGENVNSGTWNNGQTYTKNFNTTLNAAWQASNCKVQIFVYKDLSPLNTAEIQQGIKRDIQPVGINNENSGLPQKYELAQNYPNPFNPVTNIHFAVPRDGNVSLKIYDITGKLAATYIDGFIKAGYYNAEIYGTEFASGTYFYTLKADGYSETKKMVLIK